MERILESHPTGLQYAQVCAKYRAYQRRIDWVLRKVYTPGERCFVDYAGLTLTVIQASCGEIQVGQLFVAVLGFSRYTYANVHPRQSNRWWICGHMAAFQYFGGVPGVVVPDNLKTPLTKAERFDVIAPISRLLAIMGWPLSPPDFTNRVLIPIFELSRTLADIEIPRHSFEQSSG